MLHKIPHKSKTPLSIHLITVATIVCTAMLAGVAINHYNRGRISSVTIENNFRLIELHGKIVHLDEVLSMSARMAAFTGDSVWEDRYNRNYPMLNKALQEIHVIVPNTFHSKSTGQIDLANHKLIELEQKSFDLVRSNHLIEAQKILLGDIYQKYKDDYSLGLEHLAQEIEESILKTSQDVKNAESTNDLAVAGVVIFLYIGLFFLQILIKRDFAKSRKVEEALKRSEYFFKESQRAARIGSYQAEFYPNDFWTTSEVCDDIFGIDKTYARTAQSWIQIIHPDFQQEMAEYLEQEVLGKGKEFNKEYKIIRQSDGESRWVLGLGKTIQDETGRTTGLIGTIQDITEAKMAKDELVERNQFIASLINLSPDMLYIYDISEHKNVYSNDGIKTMLGYSSEEIQAMGSAVMPTLMHPEDFQHYLQEILPLYEKAQDNEPIVNTFRMKDTSDTWHTLECFETIYKRGANNTPQQIFGVIHDITKRKQTELALEEEKERLAVTLRSIGDGVITTDADGNISMLNKVAEMLTGWTSSEAMGKPLLTVFNIVDFISRQQCTNPVEKAITEGKTTELATDCCLIAKDGQELIVADSSAPIQDTKNHIIGAVLVFRDMTDERNNLMQKEKLTEQLHQSQKMEAIGQLAGGIAHDFNNSLSGIIGAAELIKSGVPNAERQKKFAEMIIVAAQRAGELAKKLLLFSRKATKVSSTIDMATVVSDTVDILEHSINKNITISLSKKALHTMVIGDDSLLQNTIMNIGINAANAMPAGGLLEITLQNTTLDAKYCKDSPFELSPGNYLEITMKDNGTGMPPEVQAHIFEPFFTTRRRGEGTGLGLAAVYGTIQEHSGAVTVYSELGVGTVFHIYLPVTESQQTVIDEETVLTGSGTILIIDDEELIRITVSSILEELGYKVLTANNGQQGVELFQKKSGAIDLVILDMIMPVMSGRDAFMKLREIDPKIPVIIASGFAKESEILELQEKGISGTLQKPFRQEELAQIVAKTLSKK